MTGLWVDTSGVTSCGHVLMTALWENVSASLALPRARSSVQLARASPHAPGEVWEERTSAAPSFWHVVRTVLHANTSALSSCWHVLMAALWWNVSATLAWPRA